MSSGASKSRPRPSASSPSSSSLKWDNTRRSSTLNQGSGRRPLPEPMTIGNSILMVVLHLCRRAVLIEPKYKVGLYLGFLFLGSAMCDAGFPIPPTYFSNKNNFLNQYFVKLGWGWTLMLTSTFVYLTSSVYCAGDRSRVVSHMLRLVVGTVIWFVCTNFFVYVEERTGSCSVSKITSRQSCIKKGHRWAGFDISGHCFLLIYSHLLIAEELRALVNWERIGDIIRNEQFDPESPIKDMKDDKKTALRENYEKFTPYVRLLFIVLTLLAVLWDVMLVATVFYFHNMVQKVFGGIFAVSMWFVTYRMLYKTGVPLPLPGNGVVKYSEGYRRC